MGRPFPFNLLLIMPWIWIWAPTAATSQREKFSLTLVQLDRLQLGQRGSEPCRCSVEFLIPRGELAEMINFALVEVPSAYSLGMLDPAYGMEKWQEPGEAMQSNGGYFGGKTGSCYPRIVEAKTGHESQYFSCQQEGTKSAKMVDN